MSLALRVDKEEEKFFFKGPMISHDDPINYSLLIPRQKCVCYCLDVVISTRGGTMVD